MPNKHFYFSIGALFGITVSWSIRKARFWLLEHTGWMKLIYRWNRYWYLYFLPFCVAIFGLIAWIPDIFHALGVFPKEVTRSSVFNLFFFHSYFEYIEDQNETVNHLLNLTGEFLLFFIAIGILFFYAFYLKKLVQKKYTTPKTPFSN